MEELEPEQELLADEMSDRIPCHPLESSGRRKGYQVHAR